MAPNTMSANTVTLCTGIEKTGKTTELIACARHLIEHGADARDLLVFAATPDAETELCNRLRARDKSLSEIRVTTVRDFALGILNMPEIETATGRQARMLTRFEESFLAEDLRTHGMAPKRIGSMMGFFRKGISELADCDPSWLVRREERDLYALLASRLKIYGAYLEPELSSTAFRALCADGDVLDKVHVRHVLIDDFHLLSRASQHLARLVARETLFVTTNPESECEAFDSYPYARGAAELLEDAPQARVIVLGTSRLSASQQNALAGLCELAHRASRIAARGNSALERNAAAAAKDTEATAHMHESICHKPEDEFTAIGAWAAKLTASGCAPEDLAVVAPNGTWARNIQAALAREGVPSKSAWASGPVGGDIRYADLSQAAQFVTLLTLAANSKDGCALRAWCGFGEYLTCRSLFAELMDACENSGKTLAIMLEDLAADPTRKDAFTYRSEADRVVSRMELLNRAQADLKDRRGRDLIEATVRWTAESSGTPAALPQPVAGLLADATDEDDVHSLATKVRRNMDFARLPLGNAAIIVPAHRACAAHAKHTAIAGMVNGFAPAHACFDRTKTSPQKAARIIAADARRYRAAVASGSESAEIFRCDTMRATDAQMHNALTERYFIKHGVRYAHLSRSIIADAMLGASIELDS